MKKIVVCGLLLIILLLFVVPLVSAQCQVTVSSKSTRAFLKEIPTIDQSLKVCPQQLPSPLHILWKNEKIAINIDMIDGSTEVVIAEIQNGFLSRIKWGGSGTGYIVDIDECSFDTALRNGNSFGVYSYLYQQNKVNIRGQGLWKTIFLTLLKPFIGGATKKAQTPVTIECSDQPPPQNPGATLPGGKPNNCDETYLPGHREYANNKYLWDSYSLDADKVCQTRERTGTPNPNTCVHTVQLSAGGYPYYLCWYNE